MNIYFLELKNIWKSMLKWAITLSFITFLMLAFFPSMKSESMQQLAGAKMEGISPELLAALGLSQLMDFTIITNFFGYVLQYLALAIMVYSAQMAVSSLSKEEAEGTIEFLYSKPVTRSAIFFQKALASMTSFVILLLILAVVTIIGYVSFSEYSLGESMHEVFLLYGAILFTGLIFMSVGILISSLTRSSKGSSGAAIAIVFFTFVLGITGVVKEQLSFLSYLSPMDWIKAQKLMTEGILAREWLIGISTIILSILAAHEIYKNKDLHA